MPAATAVPCAVVPDGDLTRAYLLPSVRTKGWWSLTMNFARRLGIGYAITLGGRRHNRRDRLDRLSRPLAVAGRTERRLAETACALIDDVTD